MTEIHDIVALQRELAILRGRCTEIPTLRAQLDACRKSLTRSTAANVRAGMVLTDAEVRVIAEGLSRLGRTAVILESVPLADSQVDGISIRECADFKNILAIFARAPS